MGLLNVHKEPGWTSHDVVARVRRLSGQRRVGHAGTLDPMAEGVLPVLLGPATRLADVVQSGRKQYHAEIQLGTATTTDDAEGDVVESRPVPPLESADVAAAMLAFRGDIAQVPPSYSAVKTHGQRAYALARRGGAVDLAARTVTIYDLHLAWLVDGILAVDVECSRGTYVRALARDLARALGTVGHVRRLIRTRVGPLHLADALTLGAIARRGLAEVLLSADAVLAGTPTFGADSAELAKLANGQPVAFAAQPAEHVRVFDEQGRLRLVGVADGRLLWPRIRLASDLPTAVAATGVAVPSAPGGHPPPL